jgi:hypothetical protein
MSVARLPRTVRDMVPRTIAPRDGRARILDVPSSTHSKCGAVFQIDNTLLRAFDRNPPLNWPVRRAGGAPGELAGG